MHGGCQFLEEAPMQLLDMQRSSLQNIHLETCHARLCSQNIDIREPVLGSIDPLKIPKVIPKRRPIVFYPSHIYNNDKTVFT